MTHRLHLLLDDREHALFRASADAERVSLAEWLRLAGRERIERSRPAPIGSTEDLRAFFAERDAEEAGRDRGDEREPEWAEHLAVLARSRRGSLEPT